MKKRRSKGGTNKSPRKVRKPSVSKWKTVDIEDIEEDGLQPLKSNTVKWNTFKVIPDPSRWEETELTPDDKILDIPQLRTALSVAYADKISGSVKGCCKIQYSGQVPEGVVQIPFHTNGVLGIVTLRPGQKFVIPNDNRHIVQRRISRWTGSAVSDDVADNLLTKDMSMKVGSATVVSEKHGRTQKIHITHNEKGQEKKEELFP
ncbi:MAG: hypothetical protein CBC12_05380 [Candidatus Puniceispirillum sp. TMED52]|jgi:hypothetical protein|nr:MAG: hypothetical protein CBC12_05380 [Candidatus Puniceispirillum sp. TMED52]RPF82259.1 MAG: hypothetical protein CBC65_000770 [Rhodothermaceae bacterium TMED105]|tara:strand:- start:191 stop:802 length:612 start_codon:yes stop_codon:yes gene_type:complete